MTEKGEGAKARETGGKAKRKAAELPRRAFIRLRLAEIKERLADMAARHKTAQETLASGGADKPDAGATRSLRQARSYAKQRVEVLRAEQKALLAERGQGKSGQAADGA